MGRNPTGSVELRDKSIRLAFTFAGRRYRETLDLAPTPANIKAAHKLLADIERQIERGTFDYAEFFPGSKQCAGATPAHTFGEWCGLWLQTKGRLAPATRSQYANALEFWKAQFGAATPLDRLTHSKVAALVGSHPWASPKLCNNYLIPLRGVFTLAGRDLRGFDNPTAGIENAKQQKVVPDPLTVAERDRILHYLYLCDPTQVANYFAFAFYTGMRPEELIALQWGDVDWNRRTIRVERAKSFRGQVKPLKTYEARDVDLNKVALDVLRDQKAYTFMKGENNFIFENPVTGLPWHDERSQRDHYWTPALKKLGIRMRRAYQTRHTYATSLLMAGVNPAYIARQMGHRNTKMLFEVYAKWIDDADAGRERAKMETIVPELSPEPGFRPLSEGESGRHDWTRTNSAGKTIPHKKRPP